MTLSDSDDVQTISSGSDDNKEREKKTQGKMEEKGKLLVFLLHQWTSYGVTFATLQSAD